MNRTYPHSAWRYWLMIVFLAIFYLSFFSSPSQGATASCDEVKKQVVGEALAEGNVSLATSAAYMCHSPCESIRTFYLKYDLSQLQLGAYLESRVLAAYNSCLQNQGGAGGGGINTSTPCWFMDYASSGFRISDYQTVYLEGVLQNSKCFAHQSIPEIVLDNATLTGTKFTDTSISHATFAGTTFSKVTFSHGKFRGAYMIGSNLWDVDLTGADFRGADFSDSSWSGVNITGLDLRGANLLNVRTQNIQGSTKYLPGGWTLSNGYLVGPGANLQSANLSASNLQNADLTGANLAFASLSKANLKNAYMENVSLAHSDISSADFSGTTMSNVDLSFANVANTRFARSSLVGITSKKCKGHPSDLPPSWKFIKGYFVGSGVSLPKINLINADLAGSDLSDANLSGANLTGAVLTGVNLSGTVLDDVKSSMIVGVPKKLPAGWQVVKGFLLGPTADLSSKNLEKLNLQGVDLHLADLRNANVSKANLEGANLSAAKLQSIKGLSVRGSPKLPPTWTIASSNLIGPTANLSGAIFVNADLSGIDLSEADLTNATFQGVNLTNTSFVRATLDGVTSKGLTGNPTLPHDWTLQAGYLLGPGANLSGANLSGQTLREVNLSGADISHAELSNAKILNSNIDKAKMSTARLTGIYSAGLSGKPDLPKSWIVVGGVISGPDSDKSSPLDLSGKDLTGVDVSQFDLTKATNGHITGIPAKLPSGWRLMRGYLIGPGVNLANADLSSLNFSGMDLTSTNFSNSSLKAAKFSGSKLSGTLFKNVDLTGAIFVGANLTNASILDSNVTKSDFAEATFLHLRGLGNYINSKVENSKVAPTLPTKWSFVRPQTTDKYLFMGPGANLRDANLQDIKLDSGTVFLDGADLSGAKMGNTLISNVDGEPVLASGWKLIDKSIVGPGAKLSLTSFSGVDLDGVDLTGVDLGGIRLQGFFGTPAAIPKPYRLVRNYILGPKVVLISADLSNLDLSGFDLSQSEISQSNFRNSDLRDVALSESHINNSDFSNSNLANANLFCSSFGDSKFEAVDLSNANMESTYYQNTTFVNAKLDGADFSNTHMPVDPFNHCHRISMAISTDFGGASLTNGNFDNATFSQVNFKGASLSQSHFQNSRIESTDLSNADIQEVSFINTSVRNSIFSSSNLTKSSFQSCSVYSSTFISANLSLTSWRPTWLENGEITLPTTVSDSDFTDAIFNEARIAYARFYSDDLSTALFKYAFITRTDFSGSKVPSANFDAGN